MMALNMKRDRPYHRQVSLFFISFAESWNMPESDPTHCEADGLGRHWLPKREGAHEVGRPSRGHLPHSVSRLGQAPEKKGPTKWEGPPEAICLAVCPGV